MQNEQPLTMDPQRADELRRQITAIATAVLDAITSAPSTATSTDSAQDRMLAKALRPLLPRIRSALLSKISASNPVTLEVLAGATATAIESILYWSPGAPLPRYRFDWRPDGSIELVPDVPAPDAEAVSA